VGNDLLIHSQNLAELAERDHLAKQVSPSLIVNLRINLRYVNIFVCRSICHWRCWW